MRPLANPTLPRVLLWMVLALTAFYAAHILIRARPTIECVDFYYYLCCARDLAAGKSGPALDCYSYFPGVYKFWGAALGATGGELAGLQRFYLVAIAANAALVGAVVAQTSRSAAAAVFGALWYLASCVPLDGLIGGTEPLVTLPALVALLVWGGRPLVGLRGTLYAVVLGAGLGTAVYMKQQGGLLAIGAVTLLITNICVPARLRHSWLALALVPLTAVAVLLAALLAEGYGLWPLWHALATVGEYEFRGSLARNLLRFAWYAPLLALATTVSLALAVAALRMPRWRVRLGEPAPAIAAFALVAGLVPLVQFAWRPAFHYTIISLPMLIVAALAPLALLRRLPPIGHGLALAGVVLHLAVFVGAADYPRRGVRVEWRSRPAVVEDLASLPAYVRPGEDVLVLPPRRNELHFFLGTRAASFPNGYSWRPAPGQYARTVAAGTLDAVVVIHGEFDGSDHFVWAQLECDRAVAELARAGYRQVAALKTMQVWRRHEPGALPVR